MKCRLPSPCPEYERFTSGMLVCPNDSAWVADDKAKTMAWMAKNVASSRHRWTWSSKTPGHWSKELTSPEDQGNINRDLHRRMAKRLRCRVSGPGKWGSSSMPYMYTSVKSKCCDGSSEALGLLCKKPGHSHLRKICSWYKHPAKSFYRGASRAMSIALNRLHVGWETKVTENGESGPERALGSADVRDRFTKPGSQVLSLPPGAHSVLTDRGRCSAILQRNLA